MGKNAEKFSKLETSIHNLFQYYRIKRLAMIQLARFDCITALYETKDQDPKCSRFYGQHQD